MDSPKYLIIISLIDGQNFTVPDGAPERVEATVFAEARFGNESILRSDPIRLTNSNPEFVTELAWQLDKKNLHQLRVERKSIKLQVFMQTRERRKSSHNQQQPNNNHRASNGLETIGADRETHKVELIGYTILNLRSAQPREHTKLRWYPLLNPKFRKSTYNRPEIQLAVTISRLDDDDTTNQNESIDHNTSIATCPDGDSSSECASHPVDPAESSNIHDKSETSELKKFAGPQDSTGDTKLYTTCLETILDSNLNNTQESSKDRSSLVYKDEILDNDIIARPINGLIYIYDAKHPHKFTIDDCHELYTLTVTIQFITNLDLLVKRTNGSYRISITLFGTALKTEEFSNEVQVENRIMSLNIMTTHAGVLATYFELYSNLDIKLIDLSHSEDGASGCIGIATIQLNQLCSLDTTCRSIEGIFALQSTNHGIDFDCSPIDSPSIGVAVVLERSNGCLDQQGQLLSRDAKLATSTEFEIGDREYRLDAGDYLEKSQADYTHQLTLEKSDTSLDDGHHSTNHGKQVVGPKADGVGSVLVEDHDSEGPSHYDHHYCFTIDLKEFSYTPSQRLIPTLRELVIRYSYPFFGYKDTITTDATIPINATRSIIVSGFCEFNFATTPRPLMTALSELPLDMEILAADEARLRELDDSDKDSEMVVATCSVNLAQLLDMNPDNVDQLRGCSLSTITSVPIFSLSGDEIGHLQLCLNLKDLGPAASKVVSSLENLAASTSLRDGTIGLLASEVQAASENSMKIHEFIVETRKSFDLWKEDSLKRMFDELRRKDNDRFKRLYQRIEAKEVKRDQEFRRKMEDLNNLEKKFRYSLNCIESLEKMLVDSLEHLKNKNALLDDRLDMIELKISQVPSSNLAAEKATTESQTKVQKEAVATMRPIDRLRMQPQRSFDESLLKPKTTRTSKLQQQQPASSYTSLAAISQARDGPPVAKRAPNALTTSSSTTGAGSINRTSTNQRSSSLARRPSENSATIIKMVKRSSAVGGATVVNETNPRARSNSAKLTLTKETREKLMKLRKERADLLKRGCKSNDELIREINALIEKLAC